MVSLLIGIVIGLVPGAAASFLFLRKNKKITAELNAAVATASGIAKKL